MEHSVQIFNYNNAEITFEIGNGEVMVNATEMARPFGKRPVDYLRLPSTQELIQTKVRKSHLDEGQLVRTVQGGLASGTWMHENIALDFAQWLSIEFKLWCNDRIRELLKHGATISPAKIEEILTDPDTLIRLATSLKQERMEKDMYRMQAEIQERELRAAAQIVSYANKVLQSTSVYVTDQIAKELGTTAVTLNRLLEKLGVQFRRNLQWVLAAKYSDRGFTKTRTYAFTHRDGNQGTNTHTVWTEVGRRFIHDLVAANHPKP